MSLNEEVSGVWGALGVGTSDSSLERRASTRDMRVARSWGGEVAGIGVGVGRMKGCAGVEVRVVLVRLGRYLGR